LRDGRIFTTEVMGDQGVDLGFPVWKGLGKISAIWFLLMFA
jgi:hypothetical protein